MESMLCPYCECRVKTSDVDDEGGVCPECGAVITPSHLVEQDRMADNYDREIEGEDLEIEDEDE